MITQRAGNSRESGSFLRLCQWLLAIGLTSLILSYHVFPSPAWSADFNYFRADFLKLGVGSGVEALRLVLLVAFVFTLLRFYLPLPGTHNDAPVVLPGRPRWSTHWMLMGGITIILTGYNLFYAPGLLRENWDKKPYQRFVDGEYCPRCSITSKDSGEWPSMAAFYEEARGAGIFKRRYPDGFTDDPVRMYYVPYWLYYPYSVICFGIVYPLVWVGIGRRFKFYMDALASDVDRVRRIAALGAESPEGEAAVRLKAVERDVGAIWTDFAVIAFFCALIVVFEYSLGCHTLAEAAQGLALLAYFGVLASIIVPVVAWVRYASAYQEASFALRDHPDALEGASPPDQLLVTNLRNQLITIVLMILASSIPAFKTVLDLSKDLGS